MMENLGQKAIDIYFREEAKKSLLKFEKHLGSFFKHKEWAANKEWGDSQLREDWLDMINEEISNIFREILWLRKKLES